MSNLGFFSISKLACAGHTPETKKIWQSWLDSAEYTATEYGRQAVISFAKNTGFDFNGSQENVKLAENAFAFLLVNYPGASKSYIMRQAIINYS